MLKNRVKFILNSTFNQDTLKLFWLINVKLVAVKILPYIKVSFNFHIPKGNKLLWKTNWRPNFLSMEFKTDGWLMIMLQKIMVFWIWLVDFEIGGCKDSFQALSSKQKNFKFNESIFNFIWWTKIFTKNQALCYIRYLWTWIFNGYNWINWT